MPSLNTELQNGPTMYYNNVLQQTQSHTLQGYENLKLTTGCGINNKIQNIQRSATVSAFKLNIPLHSGSRDVTLSANVITFHLFHYVIHTRPHTS